MATKIIRICAAGIFSAVSLCVHAQSAYVDEINAWRAKADTGLRKDTGWLTLAGRWELAQGSNRIGTAKENDIVFPPNTAPAQLGEVRVEGSKATLILAPGIEMATSKAPNAEKFTVREMLERAEKMEWVHLDRLALTTFKHPAGKMILRIADQENEVRKNFQGRIWFGVQPQMKLAAKFVPAAQGKKQKIVNVLGEITDEDVAGNVEFTLNGKKHSIVALGEPKDEELFIVFNDKSAATNGNGSYPAGRFLVVNRPKSGNATTIDFNRAYNPPCAFSAFTSCPLPPLQNQLNVKIAAGEKYRG